MKSRGVFEIYNPEIHENKALGVSESILFIIQR